MPLSIVSMPNGGTVNLGRTGPYTVWDMPNGQQIPFDRVRDFLTHSKRTGVLKLERSTGTRDENGNLRWILFHLIGKEPDGAGAMVTIAPEHPRNLTFMTVHDTDEMLASIRELRS